MTVRETPPQPERSVGSESTGDSRQALGADSRGEVGDELTREMVLAFAPLHKRALGTAVGLVFGVALFLVTALPLARGDVPGPNPGDAPELLDRVSFLIPLYDFSWTGAVLGSLSAAFAFFCAGWFLAFARNFVLAASIWILRTRAEFRQAQNILDHI